MTQHTPGWYPDSAGTERWWDGVRWSDFTRPLGSAGSGPGADALSLWAPPAPGAPASVPTAGGAVAQQQRYPTAPTPTYGHPGGGSPATSSVGEAPPLAPGDGRYFGDDPRPATPPKRSGRRTAWIVSLTTVVVLAAVVAVGLTVDRGQGNGAEAVAQRFVNSFLMAEECNDSVLTVINGDTTDTYRGSHTVTCDDVSFTANPASLRMTLGDPTAQSETTTTLTLTIAGSSGTDNGTYTLTLVKQEDAWKVDSMALVDTSGAL